MDRLCYALFGVFVGVVGLMIVNSAEPQPAPEEEAAYSRFVHKVPALRVGDLAIMDDSTYVVVRPDEGNGHVLIRKVHPVAKGEEPIILHGGLAIPANRILPDFWKTKELVRRGEPRWLEIQKQLQEAALQK